MNLEQPAGPAEHTPVTVWVPNDQLAAFHAALAAFYSSANHSRTGSPVDSVTPGSQEACDRWWQDLTENERAIWGLWADSAPTLVNSGDIVQQLGLGSVRKIPGVLAWSSRKGAAHGWPVEWTVRDDPRRDGSKLYGITDPAYAAMIHQARTETVETA